MPRGNELAVQTEFQGKSGELRARNRPKTIEKPRIRSRFWEGFSVVCGIWGLRSVGFVIDQAICGHWSLSEKRVKFELDWAGIERVRAKRQALGAKKIATVFDTVCFPFC